MHWLLLEGLTREIRHCRDFPEAMQRAFPGAALHFLDLAGAGTESKRSAYLSMASYVEDLRARFRRRWRDTIGDAWGLLGVSMGGMIALEWAGRYPDEFAHLVVVSTSAGGLSPPWRRVRLRNLTDLVRVVTTRDRVRREELILGMTNNLLPDPSSWARTCSEFAPVSTMNAVRQTCAVIGFRMPERLIVPTLVLATHADRLVHPSCSYVVAKRLEAPIRVHATAGHDLHIDAPDWAAEQIRSWVTGDLAAGEDE